MVPECYLKERLDDLKEWICRSDVDGIIVSGAANKGYITGLTTGLNIAPGGAVLITQENNVCVTGGADYEQAREYLTDLGYSVVPYLHTEGQNQFGQMQSVVEDLKLKSVALESKYVTVEELQRWQEVLCGVDIAKVESPIYEMRKTKDAWEIEQIKKANEASEKAFECLLQKVQPGMSEWEISLELEYQLRKHGKGSARLFFSSVVVSGERTYLPHGSPTERQVDQGDFVTLDFGATWNGYGCDITRTFVIGEADSRQKKVYDAVLSAQKSVVDLLGPDRQRQESEEAGMAVLEERGLAQYAAHGSGGHSFGLEVHEWPRTDSEGVWQVGNVTTIEPGVYIKGWGGVRIEDDFIICDEGVKRITPLTRTLIEV